MDANPMKHFLKDNLTAPNGMTTLFDGHTLKGWKLHPGSVGHWTVKDGVIDCDAMSTAPTRDDKQLWTGQTYGDFELHIDHARLPGIPASGPIGLQHHGGKNEDGSYTNDSSLVQFCNLFIKPL